MRQMVRTVTAADHGFLAGHRVLICDRDAKWSASVRQCLQASGVHVVQTPPQAPNANAYAERFVRSVREECLDRVVPLGDRHLRHTLDEIRGALSSRAEPSGPRQHAHRRRASVKADRPDSSACPAWRSAQLLRPRRLTAGPDAHGSRPRDGTLRGYVCREIRSPEPASATRQDPTTANIATNDTMRDQKRNGVWPNLINSS